MVSHSGSIGPKSSAKRPCLILIAPLLHSSMPCRAMRVGLHESRVSTPSGATASADSGSAMPSRWLGLSAGRCGMRNSSSVSISARFCPRLPPMAKPSKGSEERYSADSCRSSSSVPPCTTAYIACSLGSLRCCRSDRAIQRWESATDCSSRSRVIWYGGSSSSGIMMSPPRSFCASTLDSGVSSRILPSWYERKTAPCSLTRSRLALPPSRAVRVFDLDFISGPSSLLGSAREKTWKPPLSVMIGPACPMNLCSPPPRRTMSGPGCTSRW
mmetsp:Transcript_32755/g.77425  ORF Transcript_32755/g.77425 Transcript_32755/m.77425 type:complete len:271 (-) Transcript_32755:199-1011(-)